MSTFLQFMIAACFENEKLMKAQLQFFRSPPPTLKAPKLSEAVVAKAISIKTGTRVRRRRQELVFTQSVNVTKSKRHASKEANASCLLKSRRTPLLEQI